MDRIEDDLAAGFRQEQHLAPLLPGMRGDALLFPGRQLTRGSCFNLANLWIERHRRHRAEGPALRMAYLARRGTLLKALHTPCQGSPGAACPLGRVLWQHPMGSLRPGCMRAAAPGQGPAARTMPLGAVPRGSRNFSAEVAPLHACLAGANRYHLLTVVGGAAGACHTLATHTAGPAQGGGQVSLFDPNWGEFKLGIRHLQPFMARLLIWYDQQRGFGPVRRMSLTEVGTA